MCTVFHPVCHIITYYLHIMSPDAQCHRRVDLFTCTHLKLKLSETPGLSVEVPEATKATSIVIWATAKPHTMKRHISLVSGTDRKFEETCGIGLQCPDYVPRPFHIL
jgi:hypothetical protein